MTDICHDRDCGICDRPLPSRSEDRMTNPKPGNIRLISAEPVEAILRELRDDERDGREPNIPLLIDALNRALRIERPAEVRTA